MAVVMVSPIIVHQAPPGYPAKPAGHMMLQPFPQGVQLLQYFPSGPHQRRGPLVQPLQQLPYARAPLPVIPAISRKEITGDLKPWLEAARDFQMNVDFDFTGALHGMRLELPNLLTLMKEQSAGKRTIQALSDKIMLHRLLENLGVPQMPVLLTVENLSHPAQLNAEVQNFFHTHLLAPGASPVIVKPTHQSNGTGVIMLDQPSPSEVGNCVQFLTGHIQQLMAQKAGEHESAALKSLKPGFIAQPKYKSSVGFKSPLELRVVVLWGKARVAVWWWGRQQTETECPRRNSWFVRRPAHQGQISSDDTWKVVHQHTGRNPGFDRALELFQFHINSIAAAAEAIAVSVGAPFLRADFFVGDPKWGARLNEVAYGCGCDYHNLTENGMIVDDGHSIAQIIQEGMQHCRQRYQPDFFLSRLGAMGHSYNSMVVAPIPAWGRPFSAPLLQGRPPRALETEMPDELCKTQKEFGPRATTSFSRSRTFDSSMGRGAAMAAAVAGRGQLGVEKPTTWPRRAVSFQAESQPLRGAVSFDNRSPYVANIMQPASWMPRFLF